LNDAEISTYARNPKSGSFGRAYTFRSSGKPLAKRILLCPDVTDSRVIKGVNFVELRDAGDTVEIAARYNE
jgi:hypothetical protein